MMDTDLQSRLERALSTVDDAGRAAPTAPRLADDARRLWTRARAFVRDLAPLRLIPHPLEMDAIELAAYALQLPLRRPRAQGAGRSARPGLRERAEEAAELLVLEVGEEADESLLDRTARVLHEMPHRSPVLDESRLLADVVNLDDFGMTGLVLQAIQLARGGEGLTQLAEGAERREQYNYWDARLKDGFHYEPVRQLARRRLENARRAIEMLRGEVREDEA